VWRAEQDKQRAGEVKCREYYPKLDDIFIKTMGIETERYHGCQCAAILLNFQCHRSSWAASSVASRRRVLTTGKCGDEVLSAPIKYGHTRHLLKLKHQVCRWIDRRAYMSMPVKRSLAHRLIIKLTMTIGQKNGEPG
jgi:hypothetical protein